MKIGLEIHGYLNTEEKLFCNCKAIHGAKYTKPNTNICPICTGQPGAKPMLPNKTAVEKAIQISLILRCKISHKMPWQRKHYSWPDLPKGYQNTLSGAHAIPLGIGGKFEGIRITEAHLEEDPAAWNPQTGEIDYNRSGSPLIEIVTDPDFKTAEEVIEWLGKLIVTLDYVKAIDKKSGIKADVNVSTDGERVEIKNVNSMSNIKAAIEYEIKRQKKEKQKEKETRMFSEAEGRTIKMRSKEEAQDYRFISDPDLPALKIEKQMIDKIKSALPETPGEKLTKLIEKHKVGEEHAKILTRNLEIVEFFEKVISKANPKLAIHWVTGELLRVLNYSKKELDEVDINPSHFIELLEMVEKNTITELKAKELLNKFVPKSFSPKQEAGKHGKISSENEIEKFVDEAIYNNPKAVEDFKAGKKESVNFLVGQVMRKSQKRADFQTARKIIEKKLK